MEEFKSFWRNYTNFSDRTTRSGYWIAWLLTGLIGIVFPLFMGLFIYATATSSGGGRGLLLIGAMFGVLWNIAILVPSLAIGVRRLRDAGIHWALIFINFIPWIGWIAYIIMLCMPSKDTDLNKDVPVV